MSEWERIYTTALIEALHPVGDVLQVGFRSGIAAAQIHKYLPKSHTLIESDAMRIPDAKKWAQKHGAIIIEEPWPQALPRLGVFDAIFFASSDEGIPQEADQLMKEIEAQIPRLSKMRYADSDLEPFCEKVAKEAPEQLYRFLHELEQNGQISKEQKEGMIRKFHLKRKEIPRRKIPDRVFPFLKECLSLHMRKGSRFTCFLEDATSKYDDPRFFEEIITNPSVNYREQVLQIPEKGEVLIVWVEKLG